MKKYQDLNVEQKKNALVLIKHEIDELLDIGMMYYDDMKRREEFTEKYCLIVAKGASYTEMGDIIKDNSEFQGDLI